jgi:hypothetical protein
MSNYINDFWGFFGLDQVIEEGETQKSLKLRGLISEADVFNRNNRIYPKKVLEREVKRLQKLIKEDGFVPGELDHPETPTINLKNASHKMTKIWMEGSKVYGEFTIMETPAGRTVKDLIREGFKVGVSSRATGILTPIQEGKYMVGDTLKIVCWDIVSNPSFANAVPGVVTEGVSTDAHQRLQRYTEEEQFIAALRFALKNRK